nr:MAG: radical SAM protein [Vulcanisaeta sp. AZ3]
MVKVAIAYPASSRVALQSLSVHLIKKLVDGFANVYSDFVFMDGDQYVGLASGAPLRSFDIVIFSVHYELDYPRILRMMEVSGISPWGSERGDGDPLVVMGGPTLMANPEPMAPFADLVLVGDAEVLIPSLLSNYEVHGRDLEGYVGLPGFYVPSFGKHRVVKAYVRDLAYSTGLIHDTAINMRLSGVGVFGRSAVVEVMRGCPRGCLFCMEGFVARPVRFVGVDGVRRVVARDVERGLIDGVSLVGLSVGDHPGFRELLRFLVRELGVGVSVPSLRVDTLDDELLGLIAEGGQRVLTIAPESSERLRVFLGKGFSDDDVVNLAVKLRGLGFTHLKLYFMVGLPGETDDDIKSIITLLGRLRGVGVGVSLSVNPWIPKPHTPLQWLPMEGEGVVRGRVRVLRGSRYYDSFSSYNYLDAVVQALLSLGDRDVARVVFDASLTSMDRGSWRRLLRRYNDLVDKYVYSVKSLDGVLPWDHIEIPGAEKAVLRGLLLRFVGELGVDLFGGVR